VRGPIGRLLAPMADILKPIYSVDIRPPDQELRPGQLSPWPRFLRVTLRSAQWLVSMEDV
jgi:hypothetical protein